MRFYHVIFLVLYICTLPMIFMWILLIPMHIMCIILCEPWECMERGDPHPYGNTIHVEDSNNTTINIGNTTQSIITKETDDER